MSFLGHLFSGGGAPPLGSPANPILPVPPAVAAPAPLAPPTPPPAPTAAQAPQSFAPQATPAQSRQASINAGVPTFLGAAAGPGQIAKSKLG
jgi:hypothetical protein